MPAWLFRMFSVALIGSIAFGCASRNPDFDASKSHHRTSGFANTDGEQLGKSLPDLLRWFWSRFRDDLPPAPRFHNAYQGFEVLKPDLAALHANKSRPSVTWIGHATALVQIGGLNVLTDPQFSARAFPVQWAGPRRRVPLPVQLGALPHIDLVVISHNHYDHLDRNTILALMRQPGGPPQFWVPLGVDRWMRAQGVTTVRAFDWWDKARIASVEIGLVPVQHWSARGLFDRNQTLWGGWTMRTSKFSVFFSGDTGYSADFKEIGRRFQGFDLALIAVGGYEPRWFMRRQHVNPTEALRIHRDIGSRFSVGIHWGTFELTDEALDEPLRSLPAALRADDVGADEFVLFRHGETRFFELTGQPSRPLSDKESAG